MGTKVYVTYVRALVRTYLVYGTTYNEIPVRKYVLLYTVPVVHRAYYDVQTIPQKNFVQSQQNHK